MKPIEYSDATGYPDGTRVSDGVLRSTSGTADRSTMWSAPSADADVELVVHDVEPAHEYRATLGHRPVGHISYRTPLDQVIVLEKTFIEPELRDQGIGTAFIAHVLDERKARGELIIVECTMIRQFVESHPDYAGVIVTDG